MAQQTHRVNFVPNPVQKQFIESRAKADLFSSRMGEGKSVALGWSAFYHTRHNPGAKWVILRDTWENIRATTMQTFFEWFPPGIMGSWHATNRTFTWSEGVASGSVTFLGMDSPEDASKLMSREIAGFGIDEPAPAVGSVGVDELIFDLALSRLRQPNMNWYGAKLAENNPDESHWTYRRFVVPGTEGFRVHQPNSPENEQNLPMGYYEQLRGMWGHRPDLIRRFVEGEFGFQAQGKAVTPQWADRLHLAIGLRPMPRLELILLWDFGHNPTCIITQRTPMGHWLVLDALVGDGIGVEELIQDGVRAILVDRYDPRSTIRHIGDPAGRTGEQTSVYRNAVRYLTRSLGGTWRDGPVKLEDRIEPMRAVLGRTINGRGMLQVDRDRAAPVWHALRGGWHFHVSRTGITSGEPKKNEHSHPGDAMSYGAGVLFPLGKLLKRKSGLYVAQKAAYFERPSEFQIGPQPATLPQHGSGI